MTGFTAQSKDWTAVTKSHLPVVFAFVLTTAFLLLLFTFRSIVIPIKAIILNLLSVGAAYGVLVWIFQDGHLESFLDFHSTGSIISWMPMFLFVVLFGLSMDYHVFILTRIRESYDRGMSTDEAVAHGIKTTAGVVTSAAVVMIAVFLVFATLSLVFFKELGVGLGVAVLIDATLVAGRAAARLDDATRRLELVPAALARVASPSRPGGGPVPASRDRGHRRGRPGADPEPQIARPRPGAGRPAGLRTGRALHAASAVTPLGLAHRGALERVRERPHIGAGRGLEDVGGDALAAGQASAGAQRHRHLAERVVAPGDGAHAVLAQLASVSVASGSR